MTFPSWRDWLFSAKAYAAAILALFIAFAMDLPRPYWAMAAVYVVASPVAGATSSKALYRTLGTLLGAAAAVFFVPLLVNAPELLTLVVALWTGCLLFIAMLDRTPRSYVFMLAGYTLPLIALPNVGTPEAIFDTALARSEEIILGIVCAAVIIGVVFPVSISTALGGRISSWLGDASSWAQEILSGEGASPKSPARRQKLAADIAGFDMIISQLSYDAGTRDIAGLARELRGRLLMLLPLFSSLADRLHAMKVDTNELPQELTSLLKSAKDYVASGSANSSVDIEQLVARISDLEAAALGFEWSSLIRASALARLREIVNLWHDCLTLQERIANGGTAAGWRPMFRHRRTVARARYYDYAYLAFAAGSVVAATAVAGFIWIETEWPSGASFVMMTAVACTFFAGMDRPAPFIRTMLIWCGVSLFLSMVYIFVVLPVFNTFEMLAVVLAVPFLIFGTLTPRPQLNMIAMLLGATTASFVALQSHYNADFASFANEGLATLLGIGFAFVWTLVARPFGAEIAARRLVRAGWNDLAELASGRRSHDYEELSGRMLDRLGQLVPRLVALDEREISHVDGFAEVRLGLNVVALHRECRRLRGEAAAAISEVLAGIAEYFKRRRSHHASIVAPSDLLNAIDRALESAIEDGSRGRETSDALVGVRRVLFPDAAGLIRQKQMGGSHSSALAAE